MPFYLETSVSNEFNITEAIEEGNTYLVSWNGINYECIAKSMNGNIYIGNLLYALVGDGENPAYYPELLTSEPFCISCFTDD